jgi:hypothetical protein
LVNAGRVAFRRSGFDACVAAFSSADCVAGVAPNACEALFSGDRPLGAACGSSIECVAGAWCSSDQLGACGQCTDRAGPGESCAANICDSTLECVATAPPPNQNPVCVPTNAQEGRPCGTVATGFCQGHLQCVGTMTGMCVRPAGAGQACDSSGMSTSATCDIFQGQLCVAPGNTCQPATWVGPGQMCGGTAQCDVDSLECSAMNMTCSALPAIGTACPQGVCAEGAFCDMASMCRAQLARDAACAASFECSGFDYCVGGKCAPLEWQICN